MHVGNSEAAADRGNRASDANAAQTPSVKNGMAPVASPVRTRWHQFCADSPQRNRGGCDLHTHFPILEPNFSVVIDNG